MMKKKLPAFLFTLFFPLYAIFAGINFEGLDLSADNRLLFRAASGGENSQRAVFVSRLTDLALSQLTVFPEKIDIAENGKSLLVRNVFGASLVPLSGGLPRPLAGVSSFVTGNVLSGGSAQALAVSPNGRWLLQMEDDGFAYGNLVLVELATGRRQSVSARLEKSLKHFPASWSPDSNVFVYCKNDRLYYYSLRMESPVDEQYRQIGEGKINSISWGSRGDFYYIKGNTLYRAGGEELFTRALYADFLETGQVIGSLPLEFDPAFDSFWMAPGAQSLLLSKEGKNIFYYPLGHDGKTADMALPYIKLPSGVFDIQTLWPARGAPTLTARRANGLAALAWRLAANDGTAAFIPLDASFGSFYALSPDGGKALAWGEKGSVLLDYAAWKPLEAARAGAVHSCLWISDSEYIAADSRRIEAVDAAGKRRLVCLAEADEYGFEEGSAPARIAAKSGGSWYTTDGAAPWTPAVNPLLKKASQVSGRYRVYLEKQSGFPYENIPMIRNTASVGTAALLPRPSFSSDPAAADSESEDTVIDGVFSHAPRAGHRGIALCFDLYDDDAGLARVLEALNRFGIKATFFLNGDFIRRHGDAARGIREAGHEAASLFYAPVDLASSRYDFSGDYIARGLARNEDEYYAATGGELALLWHPPFFRASREIAAAAAQAGYTTIGRDVDPQDWMSRDEALRLGIKNETASAAIERIMARVKSGSIIPVRLGRQEGGSDYLFHHIETLLDSLIRTGYSVVPVSTLTARGQ